MFRYRTCHAAAVALAVTSLLVVAGCVSTDVTLPYNAAGVSPAPAAAQGSIQVTAVTDRRKHEPNWLGAIRGGMGNPLKTLNTAEPVKDLVKLAYVDGLTARKLLSADSPRYRMAIDVNQFDCNQVGRREAHIRFYVTVSEVGSGKQVYDRLIQVDKVTGSRVTFDAGVFASTEDLRKLANQALQEAVDQTLSDPNLIDKLS